MSVIHHTEHDLLLTEVQAAEFLNVSVRTLQSWRVSGIKKLPFIRVGRAIRYRLADLRAWIAENTFTSTTQADARRDPRNGTP